MGRPKKPRKYIQPLLICQCCGKEKKANRTNFYKDELYYMPSACKQCVEDRIAAQYEDIKKEVERGERKNLSVKCFKRESIYK